MLLQRFLKDRRGGVAPIFALAVVPVIGFIGAAVDDYFRAFDTSTGREVWKSHLPTSARATPLIYKTRSGRQMVAIMAGGHDTSLSHIDDKLVVFALQ